MDEKHQCKYLSTVSSKGLVICMESWTGHDSMSSVNIQLIKALKINEILLKEYVKQR